MPRRLTRKGGLVVRRLIADIPEPVFKAFKVRAAETDRMMKDLVTEALRRYLGVKEGGESKKS
jgi:plasmid stability protein